MPDKSSQLQALVRHYSRPGPRYTSYPPANHFSEVKTDHTHLLESTQSGTGPLSLYIHIPFCQSLCWYCGCHTVITCDPLRADHYLDSLEKEIALYAGLVKPGRKVIQVHFGGGTPNFLSEAQIARLDHALRTHFDYAEDAEISVELDPRTLDESKVQSLQKAGFNRASFGVQDSNPQVQAAIHRDQPHEQNIAAMQWLRDAQMHSLNVDLIYGLPHQTPQSFRGTINDVLSLKPDRLTLFSYAHVPWIKPAQKMLERNKLPSAEEKITLFTQALDQLSAAGYVHIGMDHFAHPDDELVQALSAGTLQRNFQGYSTRAGCEIIGLGVSSISQSQDAYRQNTKDLKSYTQSLNSGNLPVERGYLLNDDDKKRRDLIMHLMCAMGIDYAQTSAALGIDVPTYFDDEIESLASFEADGLLERSTTGIRITETGRFFIRNIAMCFDATLREDAQAHSKTI